MKSVEFCYWLQGFFELTDPKGISEEQTAMIQKHLALVFKHEIDPSYSNKEELDNIHNPKPATSSYRPEGPTLYRC